MDGLFSGIQAAFSTNVTSRTVFLVMVTVTVMMFMIASQLLFRGVSSPVRRRLHELVGEEDPAKKAWSIQEWLKPFQNAVLPQDVSEQQKSRAKLIQAGWYSEGAIWIFYGSKIMVTLLLPVFIVTVLSFMNVSLSFQEWMLALVFSALVGVFLPNWVVKKAIEKQHRLIVNAIPDTLDLLILCLEVGLGLRSAIQRVSSDLFISHPEFAKELELVNAELKAGLTPEQALENMGGRIKLKELDGLVSTLVDSIRYGTSIADTLRAFAADFRDRRIQAAEEMAEKITTKMVFPIVLLLVPAFFIIAAGPAILRLLEALTNL